MIETIYSDPNFLEHHGVKGMKWGQHIFGDSKKGSPAEKAVGGAGRSTRGAQNISRRKIRNAQSANKVKASKKASKMSDEELAKRIKRLEMEKRYSDLSSSDVAYGQQKTQDVLDTIGDVVEIAAGIATIATAVVKVAKAVKGQ